MLLRMAFRNLLRHKRRTFITAFAISFGLGLYIFMLSLLGGLEEESKQNLILYETASMRITHRDYLAVEQDNTRPLDIGIQYPETVIASLPHGVSATPRIVFRADIVFFEDPFPTNGSLPAVIYAVDPKRDETVFETLSNQKISEPFSAILGSWLAEDIGAEPGYPLTLITRTRDGYFQTIDVEVSDVVTTPNPVPNRALFVPLALADYMLNMQGSVTEINLGIENYDDIAAIERIGHAVSEEFSELITVDWRKLGEDMLLLSQAKQSSSGIFIFLIFIIIAVGISNTMIMTLQERTKEIGILGSMGMNSTQIRRLFLLEAAGIGCIGAIVGMLLGVLFTAFVVYVGIDYSAFLREIDMGYRVTGIIRGSWDASAFLTAFLIGVGLSTLIALIPIRSALRKSVVDALRDP